MTAQELWDTFSKKNNIKAEYEAWAFGGAPDELAELVLQGIKTATASAYPLYELENEPIPDLGYSVILNSKEEALCIIKNTKVYVVPFDEVTEEHAFKEGESDRSLQEWRNIHIDFFTKELKEVGLVFDEIMKVVCEEFEVVFKA